MKRLIIFISILFSSIPAFSQIDTGIVKFQNPTSNGYSHAAIIDLGNCNMVIISGQVALDKQGNLVGRDDLAKQTEQVFLNIKSIVEEAGGTMENLVKIGVYMKDVNQIQAFRNVRNKFINLQSPPTSTLVQIDNLFREDILIEIEGIAVISKVK